jgi:hypothetical protein
MRQRWRALGILDFDVVARRLRRTQPVQLARGPSTAFPKRLSDAVHGPALRPPAASLRHIEIEDDENSPHVHGTNAAPIVTTK